MKEFFEKWGPILRTVGLWILIVFDIAFLSIAWVQQNYVWFIFVLGISLWTVAFELFGLTVGFPDKDGVWRRQTISTVYKKWIMRVGWWGYLALFCFGMAMLPGLVLHLSVW